MFTHLRQLWLIFMSGVGLLVGVLFQSEAWGQMDQALGVQGFAIEKVDYRAHLESHIQRVKVLALAAQASYPQAFSHVRRQDLDAFLDLHDAAKLKTSTFFQLVKSFGHPLPAGSELVNFLNQEDWRIRYTYFEKHGLVYADGQLSIEAQEMLGLERLADLTDRGMDPVANREFGRLMLPASEFMSSVENQMMARDLEKRYWDLTDGLDYLSWRDRTFMQNQILQVECEERLKTQK